MKDVRELTDKDIDGLASDWVMSSLESGFSDFDYDDMKQAYMSGCREILSMVHVYHVPIKKEQ